MIDNAMNLMPNNIDFTLNKSVETNLSKGIVT